MRTDEYASYRKDIRFNLSRPHSTIDHRRTCAVIGCTSKEHDSTSPLCRRHGKNKKMRRALDREYEKLNFQVKQ